MLGIGRVGPEKNLRNLILGLARFGETFGTLPEVAWAGPRDDQTRGRHYCDQLDELLADLPDVQRNWRWLGLQSDIPALLRQCDALVHPSLYEGAPNAVCEALAAGRPVLVSAVCDHPLLVAEGRRGFLFDPRDPGDIAAALGKLTLLDDNAWRTFGVNARQYAESELGLDKMVDKYEALFRRLRLTVATSPCLTERASGPPADWPSLRARPRNLGRDLAGAARFRCPAAPSPSLVDRVTLTTPALDLLTAALLLTSLGVFLVSNLLLATAAALQRSLPSAAVSLGMQPLRI